MGIQSLFHGASCSGESLSPLGINAVRSDACSVISGCIYGKFLGYVGDRARSRAADSIAVYPIVTCRVAFDQFRLHNSLYSRMPTTSAAAIMHVGQGWISLDEGIHLGLGYCYWYQKAYHKGLPKYIHSVHPAQWPSQSIVEPLHTKLSIIEINAMSQNMHILFRNGTLNS